MKHVNVDSGFCVVLFNVLFNVLCVVWGCSYCLFCFVPCWVSVVSFWSIFKKTERTGWGLTAVGVSFVFFVFQNRVFLERFCGIQ